jgi:hypothetical protein
VEPGICVGESWIRPRSLHFHQCVCLKSPSYDNIRTVELIYVSTARLGAMMCCIYLAFGLASWLMTNNWLLASSDCGKSVVISAHECRLTRLRIRSKTLCVRCTCTHPTAMASNRACFLSFFHRRMDICISDDSVWRPDRTETERNRLIFD